MRAFRFCYTVVDVVGVVVPHFGYVWRMSAACIWWDSFGVARATPFRKRHVRLILHFGICTTHERCKLCDGSMCVCVCEWEKLLLCFRNIQKINANWKIFCRMTEFLNTPSSHIQTRCIILAITLSGRLPEYRIECLCRMCCCLPNRDISFYVLCLPTPHIRTAHNAHRTLNVPCVRWNDEQS